MDHDSTDRKLLLRKAASVRESPVRAETFLCKWQTASQPVAVSCSDGEEYVVKGRQAGRMIVNDHVIARLGLAIGAPVGVPRVVEIPSDLIRLQPDMAHIMPGLAHGTVRIRNASDRKWIEHVNSENRPRFALLAVLYAWALSSDHQLIYDNAPPHLVHSVDHGHFFPGGPNWRASDLTNAAPCTQLEAAIAAPCGLSDVDQREALRSLQMVTEHVIVSAVASIPDEWGLSMDERLALVDYFSRRRVELLQAFNLTA